ncbi:hypothetical protein CTA2_8363 [Colletotrichum tanaceti]|nr:hypothetical protein CTA2_8363 [Colletotrichum tanaceti]
MSCVCCNSCRLHTYDVFVALEAGPWPDCHLHRLDMSLASVMYICLRSTTGSPLAGRHVGHPS